MLAFDAPHEKWGTWTESCRRMTGPPPAVSRASLRYGCSSGQPSTVWFRYAGSMELIFEIRDAEEGGFYARALGHSIFTQGETWDELRSNLLEAVSLHFDDATTRPRLVQMHYVKDELVPLEAA